MFTSASILIHSCCLCALWFWMSTCNSEDKFLYGSFLGRLRTGAVRKVSSHFEYLENRSRGLDVTWQPVRGDLTVHPWTVTPLGLVIRQWDAVDWACVLCTASRCQLTSPTGVTVHGCTVRSPPTGSQVTSRPRDDQFLKYEKLLDTFLTALVNGEGYRLGYTPSIQTRSWCIPFKFHPTAECMKYKMLLTKWA